MNFLLGELIKGRILEFLQFLMFHEILLMNFTKILLLSQQFFLQNSGLSCKGVRDEELFHCIQR